MSKADLVADFDAQIIEECPIMSRFTTFGIGGQTEAIIKPRSIAELKQVIVALKKSGKRFQVIGGGSNLLASSKNDDIIIVVTKFMREPYRLTKTTLTVCAGEMLSKVIAWCGERGLSGLEKLCGIPATIGGAVMNNAGAFGCEIFDCLESVLVFDGKKQLVLEKKDIDYSHHKTSLLTSKYFILSATFKLKLLAPSVIYSIMRTALCERQEKQPTGKSAGSVFAIAPNGEPAGKLIDEAGLKGLTIGGATVSQKHANFILNTANATDKDVKKLIKIIIKKVKENYKVSLTREIEFIGERYEYYR